MDDDENQQFNLQWHNHQHSVISTLGRMYSTGALTDVTLNASGTALKAHRIVLASCSQYFAQLFKELDSDPSTLVVVLGCEATELRLLLSFMYTGEVTASRRTLPALLRLAKTLKVAGLTDADCTNPSLTPDVDKEESSDKTAENSPTNAESKTETDNSISLDNYTNFKFDDTSNKLEDRNQFTVDYSKCEERLSKLDQIVQNLYSTHRIDSPTANPPAVTNTTGSSEESAYTLDRKWRSDSTCSICHKRLSNQYNLRVHLETHAGGRHACAACGHVSRSRDALRKHVAYRHPGQRAGRE